MAGGEQIYATLLLTDSYLLGALVLAHSLRDAGTTRKLAVFFTKDSLSEASIAQLHTVYDHVLPIPRIRNAHCAQLHLLNRPELDSAFTKINLWKQTQFSKIVFMDADVVAYRAPDELFALQHAFSAAPDIGWPDIFNTGVMVLTPNMGDYYALTTMAERGISFDGADQGLLNMYFENSVHRLSFTYNVTPSAHYQYLPAYRHFQSTINMVHFIGTKKPWFEGRNFLHGNSPYGEMVGRWWSVYDRHYRTQQQHDTLLLGETSEQQSHQTAASLEQPLQTQTLPLIRITNAEEKPENQEKQQPRPSHSRSQSWDASRQPPPKGSKPEAENFPTTHYPMSQDVKPFVPPDRYPSPPKDLWYEVPKKRPASASCPPKAIFPWEGQQPEASRAFSAAPDPSSDLTFPNEKSIEKEQCSKDPTANLDPTSAVSASVAPNPWSSFTLVNAWDDVPEISRYIERSRGHSRGKSFPANPTASKGAAARDVAIKKPNFPGLKLTDFPTEVERPSLPVTPAPIRRSSLLWGDEGDGATTQEFAAQKIPTAQGVPDQTEWNPAEQLQKLAAHQSDDLLRRLSATGGESAT